MREPESWRMCLIRRMSPRSLPSWKRQPDRPAMDAQPRALACIATIVAFIAIWEIVYRLGLMPKWLSPRPGSVLAFRSLSRTASFLLTRRQRRRQITGVFLAAVVGIPVALRSVHRRPRARHSCRSAGCCIRSPALPGFRSRSCGSAWASLDRVRDLLFRHWSIMFNTHDRCADPVRAIHRRGRRSISRPAASYTRRILIPARCPTSSPACD